MSGKEAGHVARPVYALRFELEEDAPGGAVRRAFEVAASPQELEELQAQLRAAVRAAEALL